MPSSRATLCLALITAVCGVSGCMGIKPPDMSRMFRKEPTTQEGIVTPIERQRWLTSVAADADSLEPAAQEARSLELAQAILQEEDPMLRGQILRTLAQFPTETAGRVLQAARKDTDADVRIACCEAWSKRGGPEASAALLEILSSDIDVDVRLSAVRELGNLGDTSVVPTIGKCLEDRDPAMQHRAMNSLRQLTGKEYGDDVNVWREFVNGGNPPEESLASRLLRWF